MKGIRNIYRRLATLLCVALAGMNAVCWGQVYGDRYQSVEQEVRASFADVLKGGSAWDADRGVTLEIKAIINGNVCAGGTTWWKAENAGEVTIQVDFEEVFTLSRIWFDGGNEESERPQSVSIYTSTNGRDFQHAQTFSHLSGEIHTFTLNNPITYPLSDLNIVCLYVPTI